MAARADPGPGIVFRPLAAGDLLAMGGWLADPAVAAWWRESDLSPGALAHRYGPIIRGDEPTLGFVIVAAGAPIGYIQAYRIGDHPDYASQLPVDPSGVATDLFIGEPAWRGRGWGTAVLRAFLQQVVFGELAAALAVIAPEPANTRAIRCYERVGFRWVATVPVVSEDEPLESGDEYVMVLVRETWEAITAKRR